MTARSVDVRFVPSDGLQTAAWIEDAAGNYIDTVFIIVRFETPTGEVDTCGCTSTDPGGFGLVTGAFGFALRRRRYRRAS
jgi:MYXO-CTERM domain-containing protein